MPIPDREPTQAEIAALISFVNDPDDQAAAIAAVSSKTGWPEAELLLFIANNSHWILKIAEDMRAASNASESDPRVARNRRRGLQENVTSGWLFSIHDERASGGKWLR